MTRTREGELLTDTQPSRPKTRRSSMPNGTAEPKTATRARRSVGSNAKDDQRMKLAAREKLVVHIQLAFGF